MPKTLIYKNLRHFTQSVQVGGKAVNLRHLANHNFPVPKWFCLTTDFFREFLGDKLQTYQKLLRSYNDQNRRKIIKLIQEQDFSDELQQLVNAELIDFTKLAVRSSATDEDSSNHSFAGMMESYLNIDKAEVFKFIKLCFISTFSERAMTYRAEHELISSQLAPAVIIMEMVQADVAGVIFTTNPKTNDPDQVLISAVNGLGEGLVSGENDSQDFVVDSDYQITTAPNEPILPAEIVLQLAKMARAVETSFPKRLAQDLEFAVHNGEVYLLQTRVISTYANIDKNLPRTILDNSNIIESYSGVTTPLTFSFAQEVYGKVYHQTLRNFGINTNAIQSIDDELNHMLYFYQNKIYYNLNNWYKMTALYPGYQQNKKYMENMMGVKVALNEKILQKRVQTTKIYARFLHKMLRIKADSTKFLTKFNQVTAPLRNQDFAGKNNTELLQIYHQLEAEILDDFTTPIANDMGAMVFYGMLTDQIHRAKVPNGDGLVSQILSRQGGVESLKPASELMRIVQQIKQEQDLQQLFQTISVTKFRNLLKANREPIFQELNHYLSRYGARSMEELKLETITMAQEPGFLLKMVRQYLENDISQPQAQQTPSAEVAARKLLHHYHGPSRILVQQLLNLTKFFVRNRELLRLQRTYIYDIARSIFVRLGHNLAEAKIIKDYRDVFFLEKSEIFALAQTNSKINSQKWQKLIDERKKAYKRNRVKPTYERMYFYGEVCEKNMLPIYSAQEMSTNDSILYGVAGGGQAKTGIVQYITDPGQAIRPNAILMAKRADPGWIVLFPLAQAIIVERGSILSHSAVVAREMGKTLVVGVRGLTDKIHDGDKVRVDGINGTVEILDE